MTWAAIIMGRSLENMRHNIAALQQELNDHIILAWFDNLFIYLA
jgi:hypothetical protein